VGEKDKKWVGLGWEGMGDRRNVGREEEKGTWDVNGLRRKNQRGGGGR